jgi:hypothetical protein
VAAGQEGEVTAMDDYSVRLESRIGDSALDVLDDAAADELMDLLESHDGVVAAGADTWSATVTMAAQNAFEALGHGAQFIMEMAAKAGMPDWPVVRADVVLQEILDAETARPALPDLVSAPEAADILRVSPQRVHELAAEKPDFPAAVYELRTGRLWLRDAISAFDQRWDRRPGRPSAREDGGQERKRA